MINNYGNRCWLHYKLTKDNPLTYHHCVIPKRNGGRATEENGALLSREAHDDFNILEQMYPKLAKEINEYLTTYKGDYPSEVLEKINRLMELVKRKEMTTGGKSRRGDSMKNEWGICDYQYMMTHSCEKCPIAGKCEDYLKTKEGLDELPISKKNELSRNKKNNQKTKVRE